jgi:hypothetical protein
MMNPAITDPDPATTGKARGTIGPADFERGTGANPAGPCKTVYVNRTGAVDVRATLSPLRDGLFLYDFHICWLRLNFHIP